MKKHIRHTKHRHPLHLIDHPDPVLESLPTAAEGIPGYKAEAEEVEVEVEDYNYLHNPCDPAEVLLLVDAAEDWGRWWVKTFWAPNSWNNGRLEEVGYRIYRDRCIPCLVAEGRGYIKDVQTFCGWGRRREMDEYNEDMVYAVCYWLNAGRAAIGQIKSIARIPTCI
jgi:hypothetical protein